MHPEHIGQATARNGEGRSRAGVHAPTRWALREHLRKLGRIDSDSHTSATASTNVSRNDSSSVGGLVAVGGGVRGSTRGREGGRQGRSPPPRPRRRPLSLPFSQSVCPTLRSGAHSLSEYSAAAAASVVATAAADVSRADPMYGDPTRDSPLSVGTDVGRGRRSRRASLR